MKLITTLLLTALLVVPALATENPVQLAARPAAEKARCIEQCNTTKDNCSNQCQGNASCLEQCAKLMAICHVQCSY